MYFFRMFEKYIDELVDAIVSTYDSLLKEYKLKPYQRHGKKVLISIENNKVYYYNSLIDFLGGNYVI